MTVHLTGTSEDKFLFVHLNLWDSSLLGIGEYIKKKLAGH